ncbi:MAG: DUF4157 domain-containing protein [Pseudomonadota bacterium]
MQRPASQQADKTTASDKAPARHKPVEGEQLSAQGDLDNLTMQGLLQAKLTVGRPGDPYEKEADRVADNLTHQGISAEINRGNYVATPATTPLPITPLSASHIQRQCASCEQQGPKPCCESAPIQTNAVQAKTSAAQNAPQPPEADHFSRLQSGGKKLPAHTQAFYETRLGHSLDHVRLHTDANAARATDDINARAFTLQNHIAFAPGQFKPETASGQWLLAHELTHAVQQSASYHPFIQRNPRLDRQTTAMGRAAYESSRRARQRRNREQRQHNRWTRSHRDNFHNALDGQNTSLSDDIASSRASLMQTRAAMLQQVMADQSPSSPSELSGFSGFFQSQPQLPADLMSNWARAALAKESLATAITAGEISAETAELVRTAFSVFFQSLVQAASAQENHEAAIGRDYQDLQNQANNTPNKAPICHGGCHPSAPQAAAPMAFPGLPSSAGGNTATAGQLVDNNARFEANPEGWLNTHTDSIVIKVRVAMHLVDAASTLEQWQRVMGEYGVAIGVMDNLLLQRLPRSSELVQSFEYARDLLARQQRFQQHHPDAVKIPAVFYPNDKFATIKNEAGEQQRVAQGIPWMFYLTQVENPSGDQWAEDFEWELHDLTSAGRPSVRFKPNNVLKSLTTPDSFADPPAELFEQLNHKLKFPKGYLYWTAPSGQRWSLQTTEPWTLSDWLTAIGVSFAVLGIVLGTAGYGTPAAVALLASTGFAIGSTLANLSALDQHNQLTQADVDRAALTIALDIVAALPLMVGQVAKISMAAGRAAQGSAAAARATALARGSSRLWFAAQGAATAAEGVNLYLAAQDFIQQARMIQSQQGMTQAERNDALGRLVLTGLISGGLMIVSLRGNVKDLRQGTPLHIEIDPDTGVPRIRPDSPELPPGTAHQGVDEAGNALENASHRGLQPGARGDLALEGQAGLRNAMGEHHQFGLWQDGRITRCSDLCTDLTVNVLDRMRSMRGRVPPNSAHIEALRQVAAEAKALRQQAQRAARTSGTLSGQRDALLQRARALEMRASLIEENINRELSAFHTRAPTGWPVRQVDYDTLPRDLAGNIDTLPEGVVYEFPGGHRVWRLRGGGIAHESYVGPAHGRQGFEKEFYRPGEAGRKGHHRAHTLGQGTGFESPFAIPYAPAEVNLAIQNDGIEEFMRGLRDEAPAGAHFHVRTETHMRPGSLDLESITYRIEVSQGGRRAEFFEFDIQVAGTPDQPKISYGIPSVTQNPELAALFSMVDVPERVRARWARARSRRRSGSRSGSSATNSGGSAQPKMPSGQALGTQEVNVSDRSLTVSDSNSKQEQEADAVANRVSQSSGQVRPHTHKASGTAPASPPASDGLSPPTAGAPLPGGIQRRLEAELGTDLSPLRVHNDAYSHQAADALNAKAFTHKNAIFLGSGQQPTDLRLMAHEATHSVQQSGGRQPGEDGAFALLPWSPLPISPMAGHRQIQRWDEGEHYPTCQTVAAYGRSSFHVAAEAGDHEIPSEVALHVELPLPLLDEQRQDPSQQRTSTFILNQPVEMATTSVFYAVPREHVYARADAVPEAVCRPPAVARDTSEDHAGSITGPHLALTSTPLPPTAFTVDGVIDVIAQTPEVVITTTYTKLAVGAGSTTVLKTHSDYILIDAGINAIAGRLNQALADATLSRLMEINPTGHFREIILSHGHGDHSIIGPQVARQFTIGSIRTNALQLLMKTTTGAEPLQTLLPEMYNNQQALVEEQMRQQARIQAEAQAAEMPLEPDEALRRARIEALTESALETLRASRIPIALEILVPSEAGLGVVSTSAPGTTLPQALEYGSGDLQDAFVESPAEGVRRSSFMDRDTRAQLAEGELPSDRADRYSTSYIIELPNGNHLIVVPDIRSADITRSIQAMEAAMEQLGKPMRFRIWDATHHMQSGFITTSSNFAKMAQLLTRLTGVDTHAGGPSAEAIAVSVRDRAITGDQSTSFIDPATAFLFRSMGFEIFLTMGGQDIRVIEAMIGEQRVSGVVAEAYRGRPPNDLLVRRAGSTLTFIQEQLEARPGDAALLRHQQSIKNALVDYYDAVTDYGMEGDGIGRGSGRNNQPSRSNRPEVLPERPPADAAEAPPRIADPQAQALIDAMAAVEAMDGYGFREVGRIPILNEYTLVILNLETLADLSENGRTFLRNRQQLQTMEQAMPEGSQMPAEQVMDYLRLLRTQKELLRSVLAAAEVPANRTALEAELSAIEARISATESAMGMSTEGARIAMPGGRTLEVDVTTNESVTTRGQMGGINRGAAWALERMGRPLGGMMVVFTLKAQEALNQRIEDDEIPPLEALIGSAHNAYGVHIGMRMMSAVRVSPFEFVILAVMDVAQTMAADHGSDEMWWTQVTASGIRNSVQLGLLFFAEHIGSRHPAAALLSLGLMFIVDPLLEATGFYDWLERAFAFAPSAVTFVDQQLRDELLPAYRTTVGALQLADRSPESLAATGISDSSAIEATIRNYRQRARALDDDIMNYFDQAYTEAATSYVGLRELDTMRAEFLRLRHLAFADTTDTQLQSIGERFGEIDDSLALDSLSAEQVRDMDQWDEMDDALSFYGLYWEIYRTDYEDIDWDDVLESQQELDMMLRNARYRLNPQALPGRTLRTAPLISPGSPGYSTYVNLLDSYELRYQSIMALVITGDTYAPRVTVPGRSAHVTQILDAYQRLMASMEPIPELFTMESSPAYYRSYIQNHGDVMANLRRLQVMEMGAASILARVRFDAINQDQPAEDEARNILAQEARLEQLFTQRRDTHGFIYERELPNYQTASRLQEDRQLLQALSPRDTPVRPFTAEEMTALTSEELEDAGRLATSTANQIALWRQRAPGLAARVYLIHDPGGESIIGGIDASEGAVVGYVGRSALERSSQFGHYTLVSVVPLNRAAVNAIGRTLQGEGFWGGIDESEMHPDVLLHIPLEALDAVIANPGEQADRLRPAPRQ